MICLSMQNQQVNLKSIWKQKVKIGQDILEVKCLLLYEILRLSVRPGYVAQYQYCFNICEALSLVLVPSIARKNKVGGGVKNLYNWGTTVFGTGKQKAKEEIKV